MSEDADWINATWVVLESSKKVTLLDDRQKSVWGGGADSCDAAVAAAAVAGAGGLWRWIKPPTLYAWPVAA